MAAVSHPEACPALFHVGITVADLDRALAFYRDGLGLTVQSDRVAESPTLATLTGVSVTRLRIALLDAPGGGVFELLQYDDGAMGEPLPASRAGTGHVCVFVDDQRRKSSLTATAPSRFSRSCFGKCRGGYGRR